MAKKKRYVQQDKPLNVNTTKQPVQFITNDLVLRPPLRQTQNVGNWRRALISADYGKRNQMYNLYDDVLIDMFLSRSISKRLEAITNAELVFQVDGKNVDIMDDLIDTPEFEYMLTEIMQSRFWGISVLEFDFVKGFNVVSIPRKHLRPQTQHIVINQNDDDNSGISYANDPFFIEVGSRDDLGLIFKAAPYVIYKRGGFGDFAQFVELFGMPFRLGKYNPYDDATRKMLEEALEKAGSAAWAAIPNDSELELKEMRGTADGTLYENFRKACNEEILVGIVGQTMTTVNGSSKSQGEVHEDVEESINKADRRFVQRVLNRKILPLLIARGVAPKDGWFSFPEKAERVPLKDRIGIDTQLKDIVAIDPDYWYETYGVPKPADGNTEPKQQPKEPEPAPTPVSPQKEKQQPAKQKNKKPTKAETLSWWDSVRVKLADFFDLAHND